MPIQAVTLIEAFSLVAEPLKTSRHTLQNTRVDNATFSEVLALFRAIFAPNKTIGKSSVHPRMCMIDLSGTGLSAESKCLLCRTLGALQPRKGFVLELDLRMVLDYT